MKRLLLLSVLLAAGGVALAQDHDDDDDGPGERREVEVIKMKGPGGGPGGDGPGRRGRPDMEDDDEGGEGGGRRPMKGGMRRMMMMKEHGGGMGGRDMDPAMKEKFEKMHAAQEKLRALKGKFREKGADKAALKKEAKAAVGELFDAKLAMEQAMVDKMAEHLAEKKAKLAKRKDARDKLVNEKVEQLSGDAPGWDD